MSHVMNTYARLPVAFSHGNGCRVTDTEGRTYLDGLSGIAVSTLGHNHPDLVAAITAQAGRLLHTSNLYRMPQQEQLADKLSERNMEVREVVQRCEVVELLPLDNSLEEFLTFKLQRAGKQLADIMDASAVEAIRARLSNLGSNRKSMVSLLYPLAVSNLVIAAMNLAAEIGVPQVNADVVKGV